MRQVIKLLVMLAFFGKAGAQVNLQTGGATYSLPMFNWQDSKSRLNSVVALSYNSGNGLKTGDVASNIGQGWNLVAGGVITRMQVGEPDDQKVYTTNANAPEKVDDIKKYPAGYLYNTTSSAIGCPNALTRYPIFGDQNHLYKNHNAVVVDREADYFAFQFNGRTGIFILDKSSLNTSTGVGSAISLGDSKLKMTFQTDENYLANKNIRTTIKSFTIQDENGLIYRFNDGNKDYYGTAKVLKSNYCDRNLVQSLNQPTFDNGGVYNEGVFDDNTLVKPFVINSWYLAEIEDVLTHRKIIFNYDTRTSNALAGIDIATNNSKSKQDKSYVILSHKRSITNTKALLSITYPDGHIVALDYGKMRIDMDGDKVLSSVGVTYNGRSLSYFQLHTSYFILNRYGNPSNDYQKAVARLCLRSVMQFGADLKAFSQPYVFDYYLGGSADDDIVPPPFSPFKDIWGFYNGKNSSDVYNVNNAIQLSKILSDKPFDELGYDELRGLCFLLDGVEGGPRLNLKQGYAKNGLLKQITYPTGGSMLYDYQQNSSVIIGTNTEQNIGGVHVSATKLIDPDPKSSNDCDHPLITNYHYNLESSSTSSLWGVEMPKNSIKSNSHYEPEGKHFYWHFAFDLGCENDFQYPGILAKEQSISLDKGNEILAALAPVLNIVSGITTVLDVINLISKYSGTNLVSVILDVVGIILNIVLTCFLDEGVNSETTIIYNSDINSGNPLPSQYSRVEVVQGTGGIGKTVFEFMNPYVGSINPHTGLYNTYAIWQPTNPILSMRQRFAYWAYGLPTKTTVYNAAGNKVKETENFYDFSKAQTALVGTNNEAFVSCKCQVQKSSSQKIDDWQSTTNLSFATTDDQTTNYTINSSANEDLKAELYNIYTGRVELSYTHERLYDMTDVSQNLETVTRYEYNTINYQPNLVETTQSNGQKIYKELTYSCDYSTGMLNILKQNNIVGVPVTTSIYLLKCNQQWAENNSSKNDFTNTITASLSSNSKGPSIDELLDTTVQPNMSLPGTGAPVIYCVKYYLSTMVTEYAQLGTGDIKPYRTFAERTNQPIPQYNWSFYISPTATLPPAFTEVQHFTYDVQGNLKGMTDEGGHMVSNIYGYDDKYVIASVINAETTTDKPAYTSFETNDLGGWSSNGGTGNMTGGVTGQYAFDLNGKSLTATNGINISKPYKVSLWANSNVNVSGATLVKSAPTINGLTYYEYDIAQGNSNVTITGNAIIDELRLYPATARMRTVTYDPLIGKTAEADENNRLTYYEYDELGRLRFIKDDYRNIVKMYEYNSKKVVGCTVNYSNKLIQEYLTKTCGAGYVGTKVLYTVPAGKYSSIISQEDVDMQVQNEIDGAGQAFADNTANGGQCLEIFYNDAMSQNFTAQCSFGKTGSVVSYNVPANRYSAYGANAKTRANKMATDEIKSNGQSYANANGTCSISTDPIWKAPNPSQVRCGTGNNAGRQEWYMQDVNPNSPTYGNYQWNAGPIDYNACPLSVCQNCSGAQYKCINNYCEQGYIFYTGSTYMNGQYYCVYHYEWSDGSWSIDYYQLNGNQNHQVECLQSLQ